MQRVFSFGSTGTKKQQRKKKKPSAVPVTIVKISGVQHFIERHFVYFDSLSKVFVELPVRRMHFRQIRHLVELPPSSKYLVDAMFCSVPFLLLAIHCMTSPLKTITKS